MLWSVEISSLQISSLHGCLFEAVTASRAESKEQRCCLGAVTVSGIGPEVRRSTQQREKATLENLDKVQELDTFRRRSVHHSSF